MPLLCEAASANAWVARCASSRRSAAQAATRGADRLPFGEDRRDEHSARMAAQRRDIVIVERMPGGAVDPRRLGRLTPLAAEVQGGFAICGPQRLAQELRRRVTGARDHRRDAIDKPDPGDIDCLSGQPLEGDIRDETAEVLSQRHQFSPD